MTSLAENNNLKTSIERAIEIYPSYKKKIIALGLNRRNIEDVSDLESYPFMLKEDLKQYRHDKEYKISRYHSSSGTSGEPMNYPFSKNDLKSMDELLLGYLEKIGITEKDVVLNSFSYGLFTGGLILHSAFEKAGVSIIPTSVGRTINQIKLCNQLRATVIACTPTYLIRFLITYLQENKNQPLPIKTAICGGEIVSEEIKTFARDKFGIEVYNIYGLSEAGGPGVAMETQKDQGLLINNDYYYAETIPYKDLGDGYGELVLTSLKKDVMPLIRYRTGDLVKIDHNFNSIKGFQVISDVLQRMDDMLIIKGVNIYPQKIDELLFSIDGIVPIYTLTEISQKGYSELKITIELLKESSDDRSVEIKIKDLIKETIGISPIVEVYSYGYFDKQSLKLRKICKN
ncbi:AMP-binding protein [Enterococcus ureasiticus]|uniref:phenylacetate--CoA ligase family protein n=1 Tax=Enterococcus ureasiticus TaxID=903984 RepID=UPI001A8FEDF2|nr:AMP-binding protein [Enterococcus ureasiticus]MBO0474396.1 AMP-binding protein [Enterococcus ureasiticus]